MPILHSISYSAWSERARWALDYYEVPYTKREFIPMISNLPVRISAGKWSGRISVPILIDGKQRFFDSYDIALYADRIGGAQTLFPTDAVEEIRDFNELSDRMLASGRALTTEASAQDSEVLVESVPFKLGGPLKPLAVAIGRSGAAYLKRKYDFSEQSSEEHTQVLRDGLTQLRAALGGDEYVFDRFTFADLTMAVSMQFVSPVDDEYVRIGRKSRPCWTRPELAREFADLIEWRDGVYAKHRR